MSHDTRALYAGHICVLLTDILGTVGLLDAVTGPLDVK